VFQPEKPYTNPLFQRLPMDMCFVEQHVHDQEEFGNLVKSAKQVSRNWNADFRLNTLFSVAELVHIRGPNTRRVIAICQQGREVQETKHSYAREAGSAISDQGVDVPSLTLLAKTNAHQSLRLGLLSGGPVSYPSTSPFIDIGRRVVYLVRLGTLR
jgi:hypothetical protein